MLREEIISFAEKEYNATVEHPFRTSPDTVVLRHKDNQKWYALFMYVKKSTIGLPSDEYVDILDIKADPVMLDTLTGQPGYLPGYHMNKKNWMTVLLDGTVSRENILNLLEVSYALTASKNTLKTAKRVGPKDWITPANPKYYDVISAFENSDIIEWNQSGSFQVGDLVYMYVGAPFSSIMFKCKVLEIDIPYTRKHEILNIKKLMKIKLLGKIPAGVFTFDVMKEYGVYAVRGPRSIPNSLRCEIDRYLN